MTVAFWFWVTICFVANLLLTSAEEPLDVTGRYRLYSSTNFDQFLQAMGVGYLSRLAATKAVPDYVVSRNADEEYTLRTVTSLAQSAITFKSGVPFQEDRLDGLKVRSVVTVEGNKWTHLQFVNPPVTIIREFTPNEVKVTSTINNIISVRKYRKLKLKT